MKGGRSRVIPTSPPPSYRTCLDQTLGGPAHIEVVVRLGRTSGDRVKKTGSVAPLPSVSSSSHIGSSDYMPEKRNVRFCGVLTKEHRSAFHRASKFTRTNPISTLQSRWAACEKKRPVGNRPLVRRPMTIGAILKPVAPDHRLSAATRPTAETRAGAAPCAERPLKRDLGIATRPAAVVREG